MREEAATVAAKSVASGAAAVAIFGLTWWAWAAAFIGAAASYHFETDKAPETLLKLALGIAAVGFAAAMFASAIPHWPMFGWTGNVLVEVRAGIMGLLANPTVKAIRWLIDNRKNPSGG